MARRSSDDDAGAKEHADPKRSKNAPGSILLEVIFSASDEDGRMICNVAMLNNLQRKGGYSHQSTIELGRGTRANLKRQAETWHPNLYTSLLTMDEAGKGRAKSTL